MKKNGIRSYDLGYYLVMILPTLIIYSLVMVAIILTLRLSLFQWNGINKSVFVGFHNYIRFLKDWRFVYALRNIGILILSTIIFQVFVGIFLAYLFVDFNIKAAAFFKTILFIPVVISNIAVALYFISLYDYEIGLLNHVLVSLGLNKINFLGAGKNTIYFLVIPQTWQYIGLMFIIAYTGFTTVSSDYIDTAKIEGLNGFQRLVHIYLPISWDSVSICFILAMVGPLKAFEHIWILAEGGSDQLAHTPGTLMYYLGFLSFEYGYGSAIAFFIFILAIALVLLFRISFRRKELQ